MKRTFRFSSRIKGCDIVFSEGFEPGEIEMKEIVFDIPEDASKTCVASALLNKQREVLEELIEVVITEVED